MRYPDIFPLDNYQPDNCKPPPPHPIKFPLGQSSPCNLLPLQLTLHTSPGQVFRGHFPLGTSLVKLPPKLLLPGHFSLNNSSLND